MKKCGLWEGLNRRRSEIVGEPVGVSDRAAVVAGHNMRVAIAAIVPDSAGRAARLRAASASLSRWPLPTILNLPK